MRVGDVFGIIVLIVIYALAAGASRKKINKKAKEKAGKRARQASEKHDDRGFGAAFAAGEAKRQTREERPERMVTQMEMELAGEGEDPCHPGMPGHERGIHLHETTQEAMSAAGEGEDPCHVGTAPSRGSAVYDSPIYASQSEDRDALAQDVLHGVIMSEILTRPAERRAVKRAAQMKRQGA